MPMPAPEIEALILEALPDAVVALEDLTGGADHWSAQVVSEAFAGLSRIEQHRLVYAALGEAMHGPIHALALKTHTPDKARERGLVPDPEETP